jgi:hypothetical protein
MSCLSTGYSVSCSLSCAGGLDKFWLASVEDVASLTITSGEVTAISMVSLTKFYEFQPYQETASFTETGERTNCNTVITQTLVGSFPCHSQDVRDAIAEMQACCCGFVIIHQENGGGRWIWGTTNDLTTLGIGFPAQLTNFETTTGTAINDQNQATVTLTARTTVQALPLDGAVVIPV